METPNNTATHVLEAIVTEILARLPLRSISRFKSVSKTWKSAIESVYFRRLFESLHQNNSSCWSLLFRGREFIELYGCQTWGLPKSLGSYIQNMEINRKFTYIASSNGLVLIHRNFGTSKAYVGNPVLQQWVEIPSPPDSRTTFLCGLVTRVDKERVVLSFKVVRAGSAILSQDGSSSYLSFYVYSSETGTWIREARCCPIINFPNVKNHATSLNGTLYFPQREYYINGPVKLLALDFYGKSNQCQVTPLPEQNLNHDSQNSKTALTTSSGFVMYIKTLAQKGDNLLKVWRLINDSAWQLMWEINLPSIQFDIGYYAPMAMHPFDLNIVYLWSQEHRYVISCNLKTQNYKIFGDELQHQDCFINQSACEKHMDEIYKPNSFWDGHPVVFYQFVLPQWMESMPRPAQVEMLNTTSLLSHVPSWPLRP